MNFAGYQNESPGPGARLTPRKKVMVSGLAPCGVLFVGPFELGRRKHPERRWLGDPRSHYRRDRSPAASLAKSVGSKSAVGRSSARRPVVWSCVIRPFSVLGPEHLGLNDDIEMVEHLINATVRRRLPW